MTKIKVDPEIVKARNRARSHFRREAKQYEERSEREAREALYRASNWANSSAWRANRTRSHAIVRWVTNQAQVVLASLDITPRMNVSTTSIEDRPVASAMTDFQEIRVVVNTASYDEDKTQDVARLIALTKGLIYHEGGHILYTIPVIDLVEKSKEQGYDPAFRPMNTPPEASTDPSIHEFRWVWNLLEDQRMECAVVRMSPIIERYLQVVVLDVVTKSAESAPHRSWPFLTGRSYLPKSILSQYRRIAVEYAQQNDQVEVLREIDRLVREYKRATTEREMAEIVYTAIPVLKAWLGGLSGEGQVDDHHGGRWDQSNPSPSDSATDSDEWPEAPASPSPSPSQPETTNRGRQDEQSDTPKPGNSGSQDDDWTKPDYFDTRDRQDDTASGDESDSGDDSDGAGTEGEGSTDEPSSSGNGSTLNGGDTPTHNDDQRGLHDDVNDAMSEIIDDLVTPEQMSSLAGEINDSVNRGIAFDPTIQPMPSDLQARAYEVRAGMLDTLEPLAVQADPSWRFRKENGVLDPSAFSTREPGETDFWVGLDDDGATGHDLAVSVVLDVSYSMDQWTDALSVGALGIRMACDDLDIPCTLSTFASEGYLWMNADEPTELTMVHAHGGTEPLEALEDLGNQRHDKSRHLVVVFTDGEWSGVPSFDQFRAPGSYIIGVGFGRDATDALSQRRPDALVALSSIDQLPAEVTKALIGYLI